MVSTCESKLENADAPSLLTLNEVGVSLFSSLCGCLVPTCIRTSIWGQMLAVLRGSAGTFGWTNEETTPLAFLLKFAFVAVLKLFQTLPARLVGGDTYLRRDKTASS